MAKSKQKVDYKALALKHCEKVGAGIAGIAVIMLVWSAIGTPGLEGGREPDDLIALTGSAQQNIADAKWEDYPKPERPPLDPTLETVDDTPYGIRPLDPTPESGKKDKRLDPQLFPISKLEVNVGVGAFAVGNPEDVARRFETEGLAIPPGGLPKSRPGRPRRDAGESSNQRQDGGPLTLPLEGVDFVVGTNQVLGRRWVIVNGLVPIADQEAEYNTTFVDSIGYDLQNDKPRYLGYYIQRADVTDAAEDDELEWQDLGIVHENSLMAQHLAWGSPKETFDVVDKRYLLPPLSFPLGPRLLYNWGDEARHSSLPKFVEADEEEDKGRRPIAGPRLRGNEFGDQLDPLGNRRPKQPNKKTEDEGETEKIEHALFRYFDFKVQPGHKYRYRFRLVLRDPNHRRDPYTNRSGEAIEEIVPVKYLNPSVVARIAKDSENGIPPALRYAPWSETSPVATIPYDTSVLLATSEPPSKRRFYDEPEANVAVRVFALREAVTAMSTLDAQRGSLLNFVGDARAVAPELKAFVDWKGLRFNSNAVLLDIRGGRKFSRSDETFTEPGEVLILHESGRLMVQHEIEDAAIINEERKLKAMDPNAGGGGENSGSGLLGDEPAKRGSRRSSGGLIDDTR